ncbi:MAG: CBS domain-containing protein [Methanobrevibacter sp.]|jgi:CBS domain-containing protein|nr:CBS domain-containing protein [Candidatus Methanovirga basalitermitum]
MLVKDIISDKIVYISVPGNREKAFEIINTKKVSSLPVVKEGTKKLVGIITRSNLIENPDEDQIAMLMTRNPVTATLNEDVIDVANKMLEINVRRIPIVDDEELVGIITSSDLVSLAISEMDIKELVENYMLNSIPTAWEKTPLTVAFEIMKIGKIKCVVGLNNEGKLSGIVTESDFIKESEVVAKTSVQSSTVGTEGDKWSWDSKSVLYIEKHSLKFSDKTIEDVSAQDIVTINTKTRVSDCAKKMKEYKIDQIPVIDVEGELTGLIRANDLIRTIVNIR